MFIYFDAIDPLVIFCSKPFVFPRLGAVGVFAVDLDSALIRALAAGVVLGVMRPGNDGVIRPLEPEGVTRPLGPVNDGVIRPPRDEATDEGRYKAPAPTVGAESFVVATKTPQLGGHAKYCLL